MEVKTKEQADTAKKNNWLTSAGREALHMSRTCIKHYILLTHANTN